MPGPVFNSIAPITFEVIGTVKPYRFIGTDRHQAGDGDNTFGVAIHAGTDEPTTVETLGPISVMAGAAVTEGQLIQSDAQGDAIPKAAGATVARAMSSVANAGEYVLVMLIPN